MLPEFVDKWEHILHDVDKQKIPIEFIKKIVLKLGDKKQKTINIERLFDQGLELDQIEEAISTKISNLELEHTIITMDFILNVHQIAEVVQPETDKLLFKLA
jgi:hypothetical protein